MSPNNLSVKSDNALNILLNQHSPSLNLIEFTLYILNPFLKVVQCRKLAFNNK